MASFEQMTNWWTRRSWLWPCLIVFSAAVTGLLVALDIRSIWRSITVLSFLMFCPGMAFVQLLNLRDLITELWLAVMLSLAINTIVAMVLLYGGLWDYLIGTMVVIAISILGVVIQFALALLALMRRRRSSQDN